MDCGMIFEYLDSGERKSIFFDLDEYGRTVLFMTALLLIWSYYICRFTIFNKIYLCKDRLRDCKIYRKIIIMKITERKWKHILIQMVFENYEQFKKLYAVFMAMKNIFSK